MCKRGLAEELDRNKLGGGLTAAENGAEPAGSGALAAGSGRRAGGGTYCCARPSESLH